MLEITPAGKSIASVPVRQISQAQAHDLGVTLELSPQALPDSLKMEFAEAERFEKEGKRKQVAAFISQLPLLDGDPPILAITVRLRKGDAEWRYSPVVAEIVQVVARIGAEHLVLIPIPESRQFGNTQKAGCSWVVYKARIRRQWSHEKLELAVHSYLPEGVEPLIEAWVVRQWWRESGRPVPDGFFANEPS